MPNGKGLKMVQTNNDKLTVVNSRIRKAEKSLANQSRSEPPGIVNAISRLLSSISPAIIRTPKNIAIAV